MAFLFLRPDADDTDGGWSDSTGGTTLFDKIDEPTSADDSDYIRSALDPVHDICKIRLSDPGIGVSEPAKVRYRYRKRGDARTDLTVTLLQGATTIATWTHGDIALTFTTAEQTLTTPQFNAISDFTNLFLQFDAFGGNWFLDQSTVDMWFEGNQYYLATEISPAHFMLHADGADASTTFIDATGRHQITVAGNAQIDTAQSKFGGASALFDTTGDALQLDASADFAFGTGDFTVDFWVRLNSINSFNNLYDSRTVDHVDEKTPVIYLASGVIKYRVATVDQISGATLSASTWYHVALTRASGTTRLFLNGTQTGSNYTDSNNYTIGSSRPLFGGGFGGTDAADGWLDELRVLKGTAAWTNTFTPPTAPYNVALQGPYAHLSCSRASIGYAQTVAGTLTQFASNELRITDKGLLVEDARTNYQISSQDITTTEYTKSQISIGSNTTAPDGTNTGQQVIENSTASVEHRYFGANIPTPPGGDITWSVFVKNGTTNGRRYVGVANIDAGANRYAIVVDTVAGTITQTGVISGSPVSPTSSIEAFTNGWYRVSIKVNDATGGADSFLIFGCNSATPTIGSGGQVYNGDGVSNFYVWGHQVEAGSFPSSYIPTTSAAATRAADSINITSTLNTLLVTASATAVFDVISNAANQSGIMVGDSTSGRSIITQAGNDAQMGASGYGGYVFGTETWFTGVKTGQAWTTGNGSISGDGQAVQTSATPWISFGPSSGNLYVGSYNGGGFCFSYFRRLTVWNSKLADATLQTLTDPAHTTNFTTDAASIDLDFANAAYNAITLPTDFLMCSRASIGYAQTVAGTLQQFGANQLRITDLGLLVEDARTNVALRSQEFDNSGVWTVNSLTVSADATTAPDGTSTADKLVSNAGSGFKHIDETVTLSPSGAVTWSFYAKAAGYNYAWLVAKAPAGTTEYEITVDLTNATVTNNQVDAGSPTGVSYSAEQLAGGWVRCILTMTGSGSNTQIIIGMNSTSGAAASFTGDGTSGIYVWGAQVEQASFPSSYIPTTSGSATRAADSMQIIGAANSVIVGSDGSNYLEVACPLRRDDAGAPILIQRGTDSYLGTGAHWNGASNLSYTIGNSLVITGTTDIKWGLAWDSSNRSVVAGGGTVSTSATTIGTAGTPYIGFSASFAFGNNYYRRVTFWNSKLADATLQGFTNP